MTAAEILRKAATLPWTQGELARDVLGRKVHWAHPEADCWCAEGAIYAASFNMVPATPRYEAEEALRDVVCPLHGSSIPQWNDAPGRTHAEVSAKMIEAAELLEARGK